MVGILWALPNALAPRAWLPGSVIRFSNSRFWLDKEKGDGVRKWSSNADWLVSKLKSAWGVSFFSFFFPSPRLLKMYLACGSGSIPHARGRSICLESRREGAVVLHLVFSFFFFSSLYNGAADDVSTRPTPLNKFLLCFSLETHSRDEGREGNQ